MRSIDNRTSVGEAHDFQDQISQVWVVYLLQCSDGTIYTGCTNDLKDRLHRHGKREINYTSSRLPVKLVTYITFSNKYKEDDFEKYLKSGSGKAFAKKRFL